MKAVAFAFLFTILVIAVTAQRKSCRKPDDCDETECCVNLGIFGPGRCKPLASEGKPCIDEEDEDALNGRFLRNCPCAAGLTCEAEDEKDLIVCHVEEIKIPHAIFNTCNDDLHADDQHIFRCPCAEELTCEAEKIFGKIKINQRCVSGSGSTPVDETVAPTEVQAEE